MDLLQDWKDEWYYDSDEESDEDDGEASKKAKDLKLHSVFPVAIYGRGDEDDEAGAWQSF